ncbi:patronin isoform X2 [Anopheles maculipalpis]|uniref:patronin isoform X2 n=1 Tax=Anopheles maculipalpis TaxID=1496333 RepID=UPI002158E3D6|nr:patronin isoform X2 [Anopheles maculipalpis]
MENQQQQPSTRSAYDMETQESRFAKQRSSVRWLLSKAYNNRVPEILKDPFYRDHEGQDHLKPQIVVGLGNASIYCQVLSNIYSDPNYQSLNHWSILQTLSRKGVPLNESSDQPLTETVLIQTNPLRINAHMTVIEALMVLYAKEVASSGRISSALERISGRSVAPTVQHHEAALLSWISHVCGALKKRIDYELTTNGGSGTVDEYGQRHQSPDVPPVRDFRELCDGVCLAYLISYYCPKLVPWHSVKFNHVPTIEDSIHNILIVSNFSERSLPYTVFHMSPEDITYMRGSMKQNLVVLLADLFNLFEIHPAKCVCYPGMEQQSPDTAGAGATNEHGIAHRRGFANQPTIAAIPDLRPGLDSPPSSSAASSGNSSAGGGNGGGFGCSSTGGGGGNGAINRPPFQVNRSPSASTLRKHISTREIPEQHQPHQLYQQQQSPYQQPDPDEGFVVHRSKGVPTLSSLQEPLVPARIRQAKEKTNNDSKAEERGDSIPAGRPSNWEESRKTSFSGRRSRRNSFSDDSQLTIENFGGSQDQLNTVGRFERERKISNTSLTSIEPVVPARSSLADARGSIQFGYDTDSGNEKQDRDTEKLPGSSSGTLRRHNSTTLHSNSSPMSHSGDGSNTGRGGSSSVERDLVDGDGTPTIVGSSGTGLTVAASAVAAAEVELTPRRKTSFATLPNTTTWQQQAISVQKMDDVDDSQPLEDATKISTIKLKLEEKRRLIEQEKRRIETAWTKQLQTVGKQAFLQAISKSKSGSNVAGEPESTSKESNDGATVVDDEIVVEKAERPCSLKDLDDHSKYEQKWNAQIIEPKKTPDLENMDLEQYQQSISKMNSNLHDIQADIQRLTQQQNQIQAQTLQAQQLLHAQQIANLLNQQYGSQQSIPANTYRQMNTQMFGSSPHLPQQQSSPINYGMRPPSRDPYQPQHQQQQQQHTMQYINEQGQYVQQQVNYGHHPNNNSHLVYSREQSQTQLISDHNGGNPYRTMSKENHQYSSNPYLNMDHHQQQQQQQQQQFYHQDSNHYRDPYQQHQQEMKDPQPPQPHGGQFFLHENNSTPPQPTQRRTWAQSAAASVAPLGGSPIISGRNDNINNSMVDVNAWNHGPKANTIGGYNKSPAPSSGFSLHHNGGDGDSGYGGGSGRGGSGGSGGSQQSFQNLFEVHHHPHHNLGGGPTAASPQHSKVRNQISQMMISNGNSPSTTGGPMMGGGGDYRDNRSMPLSPPIDDMAPQSISFIGDEDTGDIEINTSKGGGRNDSFGMRQQQQQQQLDALYGSSKGPAGMRNNAGGNVQDLDKHLSKLNITSGNRTYRIPSPTRPSLNSNSFHDPQEDVNEKGFYISFDNEQPKRPKPPLRTKRSPKKDKSLASDSNEGEKRRDSIIEKTSSRETNANNFGTYSVKTASSFSSSFNEEHNASHARKSIIADNSGVSPFEPVVHKVNVGGSGAAPPSPMMMMHQQQMNMDHVGDRRYAMEDNSISGNGHYSSHNNSSDGYGSETERKAKIVIDVSNDQTSVDEMERKKEKIMLLSLQRRQQAEEAKARKEIEAMQRREKEREKEEERARKKEEQFARRQAILEAHKLKKAIEEAEREGKTIDRELQLKHQMYQQQLHQTAHSTTPTPAAKLRTQKLTRPRPKTIHVESGSVDLSEASSLSSRGKKGSNSNLTGLGMHSASNTIRRDYYRGSQDSLAIRESPDEYPSSSSTPIGRRGSYKTGREPATIERGRTLSRISLAKGANFRGRKSNSLMNLCDSDSGLGRATPPRRAPSPGMGPSSRHLPSPSGPGSLPPGLITKRRGFDDGSSDISSNASSMMDYNGPRLYKQPATKSNRGIILNAVEYCVFPGAVNRDAKQKVLEKIARSEAKHFLVLFRDAGCQFRALYGYWPENEQIIKLYGTGPSQVDDVMFDKFFKYNSGGKCFTQVHTKHLTVTIDAFTIHNSLWQGKKANLPSKKDMALVI